MINYLDYTPEELAQDIFFITWVKSPDLSTETFWKDWLETYPFKKEDVETARHLVLYINHLYDITTADVKEVKEEIFARISKPKQSKKWYYWAAAASVLLMLGGFLFLKNESEEIYYADQIKSASVKYELLEVENTLDSSRIVHLSDGSTVILQKGSKITYPKVFAENVREVVFTGEAFFEIARNPASPFIVKANQLTAKVLGTSFVIKTTGKESEVTVKTGKVAVFLSKEANTPEKLNSPELEGLVLIAGEEATYNSDISQSKIAVAPVITGQPIQIFRDTPINEVFKSLEKFYPIEVIYDEALLGNCPITASLTDEPLLLKLELICKAIQAEYKLDKNKVYIQGKGCK